MSVKVNVYNKAKPVMQWFDDEVKEMVLAWKINLTTNDPEGAWELFIDASDGSVLQAADCRIFSNGEGMVPILNPPAEITPLRNFKYTTIITRSRH